MAKRPEIHSTDPCETAHQQLIAIGVALNFLKNRIPQNFKNVRDTIERTSNLVEKFHALPRWKKWIINWILANREE